MTTYKYFRYFQPNPDKVKEKDDCVIRALCAATGKTWEQVFDELVILARKNHDVIESIDIVLEYLEKQNFTLCKVNVKKGKKRPTMQKIIRENPGYTLVGQCANHVMAAKGGLVMDLWDSSDRPLYRYWMKPEKQGE